MTLNKVVFIFLLSLSFWACKKENGTPPVADFVAHNAPCVAPCEVYFFESSERTISYEYDFGNGITSTNKDDTVLYQFSGFYEVALKVTAENGEEDIKKKGVLILPADTMFITSVELIQYKTKTTSWTDWDVDETLGEDFYMNVKQNGALLQNNDSIPLSNKFPSDLPLTFIMNQHLFDDQGVYELLLYDKDTLSSDDLLGSVTFSPLDYNNSGNPNPPSQITLTNVGDSLIVNVNVVWLN
jgi:PKD repeat protein